MLELPGTLQKYLQNTETHRSLKQLKGFSFSQPGKLSPWEVMEIDRTNRFRMRLAIGKIPQPDMLLTAAGHTRGIQGEAKPTAGGRLAPTHSLNSALSEACPMWATGLTQQDISFLLKR